MKFTIGVLNGEQLELRAIEGLICKLGIIYEKP